MGTPYISLVLPAHNESHTIAEVVRRADAVLEVAGWDREIIVVDSASTDATGIVAMAAGPRVYLIREDLPGKGRALTSGFRRATGEVMAFLDSDLDLAPESLPKLISAVEAGADCAAGEKMEYGAIRRPLIRRGASRLVNFAVRSTFRTGLRDHQTGIKAFSGAALRAVLPEVRENGWLWDSEVLWRLARRKKVLVQVTVELTGSGRNRLEGLRGSFNTAHQVSLFYARLLHEARATRMANSPHP